MRRHPVLVVLTLLAAVACNGTPSPTTTPTDPTPARRLEPPTAELPDGHTLKLELALTREQHATGLQYRRSLAPDHGMLFVFPSSARWQFWMKNTWIELDLVFLDDSGVVTEVIEGLEPCPHEPCPQYVPQGDARAVLEVPAGVAAKHAITPGATLRFSRVPDYPVQ